MSIVEKRPGRFTARARWKDKDMQVGEYLSREEARTALDAEYVKLHDGTSALLHPESALTVDDYANHVGVRNGTVKRWLHEEGMPSFKIGSSLRVDPAKADPWVDAHHAHSIAFARRSVIYIVQRESDYAYKIGWTSNLARRLHELAKEGREEAFLVAAIPGDKPDELRLHARFATFSLGLEWFSPGAPILEFIASLKGVAA